MALAEGHKANFETLAQAFEAGDVALMECQLAATGEPCTEVLGPTDVFAGKPIDPLAGGGKKR